MTEERIKLDDEARCPCGNWSKFIIMDHESGAWHCDKCDGSIKGSTVAREFGNEKTYEE